MNKKLDGYLENRMLQIPERNFQFGYFGLQMLMLIIALFYLFPFMMCIFYAFKDRLDIFNTLPIQPPTKVYLENFTEIVDKLKYFQIMGNTTIITLFSSLFTVIFSSMIGYVISRTKKAYGNFLYYFFIVGLLVPYQAIFVPMYDWGGALGFIDKFYGIIFFYIATSLPFGVFLMSGFMNTVPVEIEEAALVDGASKLRTFFAIVLPMLKPAIATLIITQSFIYWNDYLMPLLFLHSTELQTLTIGINMLFDQYREYYQVAFAGVIISSMPVVIVCSMLQRFFIKGASMGAFKS